MVAQQQYVPGVIQPTQIGLIAGTPQASANQQMMNANSTHARLANAVGGKKCLRSRGGAADIPIGQYPMLYKPQSPPDSTPNAQIVQNAQIGSQARANAANDNKALTPTPNKGGYRRSNKKTNKKSNKRKNKRSNKKRNNRTNKK